MGVLRTSSMFCSCGMRAAKAFLITAPWAMAPRLSRWNAASSRRGIRAFFLMWGLGGGVKSEKGPGSGQAHGQAGHPALEGAAAVELVHAPVAGVLHRGQGVVKQPLQPVAGQAQGPDAGLSLALVAAQQLGVAHAAPVVTLAQHAG